MGKGSWETAVAIALALVAVIALALPDSVVSAIGNGAGGTAIFLLRGGLALLAGFAMLAMAMARQHRRIYAMIDATRRPAAPDGINWEHSAERLRGILDTVPDAIISIDQSGMIQTFNRAAERIFGYTTAEVLGRNVSLLVPEPHKGNHDSYLRKYIETGRRNVLGRAVEISAERADGTLFPVELVISELHHGHQHLFTAVLRDLTDRKTAEAHLAVAGKVFESTSEAVLVTACDSTIQSVNTAFCTISGYTAKEVLGRNPRDFHSGMHDKEFYDDMWRTLLATGTWDGEIWNRRKNGEAYPGWLTIKAVSDGSGQTTSYVGVFSDVSRHKRAEEQIEYLTHHDPITDLPNRGLAHDRLMHCQESAKRGGRMVAVIHIGLNRFRAVNESYGHAVGDALLKGVAERMSAGMRGVDTVARLEGDRFCCICSDLESEHGAIPIVSRIAETFSGAFAIAEREVFITASMGISVYPLDGISADELMRKAEIAMHRGKRSGTTSHQFYAPAMNINSLERLSLETDLRKGIGRDELMLYYQPKVDLKTSTIVGAEALVRWNHPRLGLLGPSRFIALAEETGLMFALGEWVLRAACVQLRRWIDQGLPPLTMAVNLSAQQLGQRNFAETVEAVLAEFHIPPALLELELTESDVMENADTAIAMLEHLRQSGVRLALDDFGTGYSSLSHLRCLPLDTLKIDRSFVCELESATGEAIVAGIIVMAQTIGLEVVAEGVETEAQLAVLRNRDCNLIQGYLFSPPVTADTFAALVEQGKTIDDAA